MAKKKKKKASSARNGSAPRKKKKKTTEAVVALPIRRHVPPDVKAIVANHVVIRNDSSLMFQLFFFDVQAPLVIDTDSDEIKTEAAAKTHVDAHCVSRVAIPIHIIPGFIQALQTNFERQQEMMTAVVRADEESKQGKKK